MVAPLSSHADVWNDAVPDGDLYVRHTAAGQAPLLPLRFGFAVTPQLNFPNQSASLALYVRNRISGVGNQLFDRGVVDGLAVLRVQGKHLALKIHLHVFHSSLLLEGFLDAGGTEGTNHALDRRKDGFCAQSFTLLIGAARPAAPRSVRALCGFEQLNRIAVGVCQLNLFARRTRFHLVAELHPGFLKSFNARGKVPDTQDDPIPSARLLAFSARHWAGAGRARTTQKDVERTERYSCKRGKLLVLKFKAELLCVESDGARDVFRLVTRTPWKSSASACPARRGAPGPSEVVVPVVLVMIASLSALFITISGNDIPLFHQFGTAPISTEFEACYWFFSVTRQAEQECERDYVAHACFIHRSR